MELSVRMIIVCVGLSYVLAEDLSGEDKLTDYYYYLRSIAQTTSQPELKETKAAQLKRYMAECTVQTKVDPDIIQKLTAGKWDLSMKKQPEDLKTWSLCLLQKSNMMSAGGMLKQDVVLQHVPEIDKEKVEDVINKCLYETAHAPTEIAWHYLTCFRRILPKYSMI